MSGRIPALVRWIARLDEAAELNPSFPTVWIARHADAARWSLPPPEPADLADAALAKRCGGAGRLLRRRMLRAFVGRALGLHPGAIRFTRDAMGAPGIEGRAVFVSTAGCVAAGEAWSAVAASPRPVGVDLEPAGDADARWVLTEAYLKSLGRGLTVAPDAVRVVRAPGPGAPWRATLEGAPPADGALRPKGAVIAAAVVLTAPLARSAPGGNLPVRAAIRRE